jgi:hypothetical protein
MLRFKILASSVPLLLAGIFARSELVPETRPCLALGEMSLQIATAPWQAQYHVSFTEDPRAATVRVQIVDVAETADLVVVDDTSTAEPGSCAVTSATRFVGVTAAPSHAEPVIYLSSESNANYRVFVRSKSFTVRDAAALIVGANAGHALVAAAL